MLNVIKLLLFTLILGLLPLSAQQNCDYCGKALIGEYLTNEKGSYHPSCYRNHIQPRCAICKKPISDSYRILDGKSYHNECYAEHILKTCDICSEAIEGTYLNDFWGNTYHKYHENEYESCNICARLICDELTDGGYELSDGRFICGICESTAVTETSEVKALFDEIRELLWQHAVEGIPEELPITLVDSKTLLNLSDHKSPDMRGFTDHRIQTMNGDVVAKESHVYILSHLPRTVFKAILAHELMHVYLFERDLDLRSDIREGFCNLGSELVYEETPSQLSTFYLRNMERSMDPDYGLGYRKMSTLLNQKGWVRLLEDLPTL